MRRPTASPKLGKFFDARFIVAAVPSVPTGNEERANFARYAFNSIAGIKDIHLTMSEPVRMDNQQGFETVAQAKDANTSVDVMVVQWLRFGQRWSPANGRHFPCRRLEQGVAASAHHARQRRIEIKD